MPAGEPLEPDVAERLDEQRRRALGVTRRVTEVDGSAEAKLYPTTLLRPSAIGWRTTATSGRSTIASHTPMSADRPNG
jgi:hypothetical protein